LKQDAVPGLAIRIHFTALKEGEYEVACAELCGLGHYTMRAFLYVDPPAAYEKWIQSEMEDVSEPLPVWKYWRD